MQKNQAGKGYEAVVVMGNLGYKLISAFKFLNKPAAHEYPIRSLCWLRLMGVIVSGFGLWEFRVLSRFNRDLIAGVGATSRFYPKTLVCVRTVAGCGV